MKADDDLIVIPKGGADGEDVTVGDFREFVSAMEQKDAEIRKSHVTPEAIPGLSPILDKRRVEMGIPDELFSVQATFGRVFIYQMSDTADSYSTAATEVLIHKTEQTIDREKKQSPRGIIISAGLGAKDVLKSNGMDVGHIVRFTQVSPYRMEMSFAGGTTLELLMMNVGDIVASEDLMSALKAGKVREIIKTREEGGIIIREHCFEEDGKTWNPASPWIGDDY